MQAAATASVAVLEVRAGRPRLEAFWIDDERPIPLSSLPPASLGHAEIVVRSIDAEAARLYAVIAGRRVILGQGGSPPIRYTIPAGHASFELELEGQTAAVDIGSALRAGSWRLHMDGATVEFEVS